MTSPVTGVTGLSGSDVQWGVTDVTAGFFSAVYVRAYACRRAYNAGNAGCCHTCHTRLDGALSGRVG